MNTDELRDDLKIGESLEAAFTKEGISVSDELIAATLNRLKSAAGTPAAEWNIPDIIEDQDEDDVVEISGAADDDTKIYGEADDDTKIYGAAGDGTEITGAGEASGEPVNDRDDYTYDTSYKVAELGEDELVSLEAEMQKVVASELTDVIPETPVRSERHIYHPEVDNSADSNISDIRDKSAARAASIASRPAVKRRNWGRIIRIGGTVAASLAVIVIAGVVIRNMGNMKPESMAKDMAPMASTFMMDAMVTAETASAEDSKTGNIVDMRTKSAGSTASKSSVESNGIMYDSGSEMEAAYFESDDEFMDSLMVVNPLVETDSEGLFNKLGFEMSVPEDAEDVRYYTIADRTAEVEFTIAGIEYTTRAVSASAMIDISGMYYDWPENEIIEWTEDLATYRICMTSAHDAGICLMFDSEAGVMFSISVTGDCSKDMLRELAEEIHVIKQN